MSLKTKALSVSLAIALSIICFELAIQFDGILSNLIYGLIEYLFTATVFLSDSTSLLVSVISTALAHSIIAIILVYSVLYLVKVNRALFLISYVLAAVLYLAYRLSGYSELENTLVVFASIRLVFHTIWLPLWFFIFSPNKIVSIP